MNVPGAVAARLLLDIEARRTDVAALEAALGPELRTVEAREVDRAEQRARLWRAHDATVRTLEARTAKTMRRLFARQEKAVLSRLEGKRGKRALADGSPNVNELFDRNFWEAETVDDTEAIFEQIVSTGFARVSNQFGISFDITAPYATDFIQARANQLAGQVTDTTYQAIKDALSEGVSLGESIPDLAARVRDVFAEADTNRSVTIARTEVNSANNASVALAAAQLPSDVASGMEWLTAPGAANPRHELVDGLDGQIVAIGEAFDVDGEMLAYPGDPAGSPDNTINCRCAVAVVTPDEMPSANDQAAASKPHDIRLTSAIAALDAWRPGREFDEDALREALRQETAA